MRHIVGTALKGLLALTSSASIQAADTAQAAQVHQIPDPASPMAPFPPDRGIDQVPSTKVVSAMAAMRM